jgi:hypothetical protein
MPKHPLDGVGALISLGNFQLNDELSAIVLT